MSNTILTNAMAVPAVAELETNLDIISRLNVQFNNQLEAGNGDSYSVILPGFGGAIVEGADLTGQDLSYANQQVSVTLKQYRKGIEVTAVEQALKFSNWDTQVAKPYGYDFGSQLQRKASDAMAKAASHAVAVASFSKTDNGFSDLIDLITYVSDSRLSGETCGSLSYTLHGLIRKSGMNLFNPAPAISGLYTRGIIGEFNGVTFSANADIDNLDTGTHLDSTIASNTITVGATVSTDASGDTTQIVLNGVGAGAGVTIKAGEVFNIAGVKNVDVLGQTKSNLFAFVVQNDVSTDASGNVTVEVQPIFFKPSTGSKPKCNVNVASIPSGAKVETVTKRASTYVRGLVWKKVAFLCATTKVKPLAVVDKGYADGDYISLLMQRDGQLLQGKDLVTWDALMGLKALRNYGLATLLVKI